MIEITTIMGNSSAPALSPNGRCTEVSVAFMTGKSMRQRRASDRGEKVAGGPSGASHAEGEELVGEPEPDPCLPQAPEPAHVSLAGHRRAFEMHASEARHEQSLQTPGGQRRDMGRIVLEAGPAPLVHGRAEVEEPPHPVVWGGEGPPPPRAGKTEGLGEAPPRGAGVLRSP